MCRALATLAPLIIHSLAFVDLVKLTDLFGLFLPSLFDNILLNFMAMFVEFLKEMLTFLDQSLLIFVNEKWPHDHLIKSVQVLCATLVNALSICCLLEVWMHLLRMLRPVAERVIAALPIMLRVRLVQLVLLLHHEQLLLTFFRGERNFTIIYLLKKLRFLLNLLFREIRLHRVLFAYLLGNLRVFFQFRRFLFCILRFCWLLL